MAVKVTVAAELLDEGRCNMVWCLPPHVLVKVFFLVKLFDCSSFFVYNYLYQINSIIGMEHPKVKNKV